MSEEMTNAKADTLAQSVVWCIAGGIVGVFLGTVVSYWFQAEALRAFLSLGAYLQLISKYLSQNELSNVASVDIAGVISTIEILAIVFGLIGSVAGGFFGEQRAVTIYGPGTTRLFGGLLIRFAVLAFVFVTSLVAFTWLKANSSMRALRLDGNPAPEDVLSQSVFVAGLVPVVPIAIALFWFLPLRPRRKQ